MISPDSSGVGIARGKRTASISLTEDVTDMCVISLKKSKVTHALLVGLSNGEVSLCCYNYRGCSF